jgi:hypothetical protein
MRVYSEFPDQHGSLTWFPYTAVSSTNLTRELPRIYLLHTSVNEPKIRDFSDTAPFGLCYLSSELSSGERKGRR